MIIHKALHLRDDINRVCVSRKEGERGLTIIEDSIDTSIQGLDIYIKKSKGRLITVTRNSTGNIKINKTTMIRKQK